MANNSTTCPRAITATFARNSSRNPLLLPVCHAKVAPQWTEQSPINHQCEKIDTCPRHAASSIHTGDWRSGSPETRSESEAPGDILVRMVSACPGHDLATSPAALQLTILLFPPMSNRSVPVLLPGGDGSPELERAS
ncbi:hypothetical protein J6590_075175 [Homalodisca vitripennis]|nr:hypothetical protein J6590_075175 [Homalodisca vitripennis]